MAENWLNNETFDFDINVSRSSVEDNSANSSDDEVFFGPQTHKEKCMAVLVQEKEALKSVDRLKPEEQAMLLRDSAQIALRIKSKGSARFSRNSPVAIVRPLNIAPIDSGCPTPLSTTRDDNPLSMGVELIGDVSDKENKAGEANMKDSDVIREMKITKDLPSSVKRKLPTSRLSLPVKPLVQKPPDSQFVEPQPPIDTPSSTSVRGASTKPSQQVPRRFSSIPKSGVMKSKSEASLLSSQNGGGSKIGKPGLAGKPGIAGKLGVAGKPNITKPKIKGRSDGSASSIGKSLKVVPVATSQLKLSNKFEAQVVEKKKSLASGAGGTPLSKKKPQGTSARKKISSGVNSTSKSNISSKALPDKNDEESSKSVDVNGLCKEGLDATPLIKNPKKPIIGRQLNSAISKSLVKPSLDMQQEIPSQDSENPLGFGKVQDLPEPPLQSSVEPMVVCAQDVQKDSNATVLKCELVEKSKSSLPSEEMIQSQVSKIQQDKASGENSIDDKSGDEKVAVKLDPVTTQTAHGVSSDIMSNVLCCEQNNIKNDLSTNLTNENDDGEVLLIDIFSFDANDVNSSQKTPPKPIGDPFETGHTPPPLIDIGDILQPERNEVNLIDL